MNICFLKLTLFLILFSPGALKAQGENTKWPMCYNDSFPDFYPGRAVFDFSGGSLVIDSAVFEMEFNVSNTAICDSAGSLLFYTNGLYVANALHDTMQNGSGINPGPFTDDWSVGIKGMPLIQGQLILPYPGQPGVYVLFHITCDNNLNFSTDSLLYSIVNMNLQGGLGEVLNKNSVLLTDTIIGGAFNACRHANGRDWWFIAHKANSAIYIKFLLTPAGFAGPYYQSIGNYLTYTNTHQSNFSPHGTRYAYFSPDSQIELFDFDRCTGMLSNHQHIVVGGGSNQGPIGVSFSPSSRFMYASTGLKLKQYDCLAANVSASGMNVAVWDSFYSPSPPFATTFFTQQLAADGKIYISCTNGVRHMHYINYSDSAGLGCDVQQHAVFLSYYNSLGGLCYQPNYHLKNLAGSACDTLTSINTFAPPDNLMRLLPNPTNGNFSVLYSASPQTQYAEIINSVGEKVSGATLAPFSTIHNFNLEHLPVGIYICRIKGEEYEEKGKFIKD